MSICVLQIDVVNRQSDIDLEKTANDPSADKFFSTYEKIIVSQSFADDRRQVFANCDPSSQPSEAMKHAGKGTSFNVSEVQSAEYVGDLFGYAL